ncbi:MerR family transcriptional regulator [Levilactobacillus brevis]|uniref:MerR family transcriptional regulator n=1 Tax=Levilactobacillus brevis TaxID=1580 RepID=UPI001BDEB3B2|nr:MerR family transcriptional regulator [Levilactobacillus brevis]
MNTFIIPDDQKNFSTKDVQAITGMTKDALRYYERLNLLGPIVRNANNYRQYSKQNLERLQMVQIFRRLGLDLARLANTDVHDSPQKKIAELQDYQQTVSQEITRLTDMQNFLAQKIAYFQTLE